MPSTYAHYRMGQEVRNNLAGTAREAVEAYPELYLIGLHGPDILFYYKPLLKNDVNRVGYTMHEKSGAEFFKKAAGIINGHEDKEEYLSYIYGVICHFALDVSCHGYIAEKIAASGISHSEIEVEFDRELMVEDGYNPVRHKLTEHIVPSIESAQVIEEFYDGVTADNVVDALKGMINNHRLLLAPTHVKRWIIYSVLRLTGNYREMHGMIVNYTKNPECDDSCRQLKYMYKKAQVLAEALIAEYTDYMKGRAELNDIYRYTFGTQLIEGKDDSDEIQNDKRGERLGTV